MSAAKELLAYCRLCYTISMALFHRGTPSTAIRRVFTYSTLDAIFIAAAPPPLLSFAAAFLLSFLDGMVAEGDDGWGDCFRASDAIIDAGLLSFSVERVIKRLDRSCI